VLLERKKEKNENKKGGGGWQDTTYVPISFSLYDSLSISRLERSCVVTSHVGK
jgi:hypothetical protein